MITLKPLTYDLEQFFFDLDLEITFMRLHNPDNEIEIVMNSELYWDISDYVYRETYNGIPITLDETMPNDKADVRIRHIRNDFITNRFMRVE